MEEKQKPRRWIWVAILFAVAYPLSAPIAGRLFLNGYLPGQILIIYEPLKWFISIVRGE